MKTSLFTLFFCLLNFYSFSCSCFGPTSFCETINLPNNDGITIIGGIKVSETEYTMDIDIIKVYQGEETRSRITVLGDTGASCLIYTSQFEIGEELILALHKAGEWSDVNGENNYELSSCGLYYVRCNNSINPYTGETEDISACLEDKACICSEPETIFYPNPGNGIFYSKINSSDEAVEDDIIYVYDISGKVVRSIPVAEQLFSNGILELNLSDLAAGVYIIQHSILKGCEDVKGSKVIIF